MRKRKRVKVNRNHLTDYHIPPRSRGKTRFIIEVPDHIHKAYHILFGSAGSLEECIKILERDWWFKRRE